MTVILSACGEGPTAIVDASDGAVSPSNAEPDAVIEDAAGPAPDGAHAFDSVDQDSLDDVADGSSDVADGSSDGIDGSLDAVVDTPWPPTWWQCRRALTTGSLTEEMEAACDLRYQAAPSKRRYGLRLVVLDGEVDPEPWFGPRLEALNALFAPAEMSFEVTSTVWIDETPIVDVVLDPPRSFEALTSDTAQHLGLEEADPAAVLQALKGRLEGDGVAPGALEVLTLETALPVRQYLGVMARARAEEIHVILAAKMNGVSVGGTSTGPGYNPTSASFSVVNLRVDDALDPIVLAHEMGHYFGLKHPHVKLEAASVQAAYSYEEALAGVSIDVDVLEALTAHFGPELDGPLGEPYVSWRASMDPTIKTFDGTRAAVSQLWLRAGQTYWMSPDGPADFEGLADFIARAEAGEAIFYKNFNWPGGTNCGWDTDLGMFSCWLATSDEGETETIPGDDPLLEGTITLDGGLRSNVMTYIAKTLEAGVAVDASAFVPAALEVLRFTANAPVRQLLRNHAL
ncbi:MAG: hypothetical protein QF464_08585 [Myxococcota bacterium]|nr:hypothetical protein [Myxococcota bacterium]